MALRQPFTRPLSLDETVEAVYQDALSGRSVAEAAREYAHQLDDRDIAEVIVVGIADMAHRRLARQRKHPETEQGGAAVDDETDAPIGSAPTKSKPHAAADFWRTALGANYEGADGTRKALVDFNLDDALHLRNLTNKRADGLIRIRDAMDEAVAALRKHGSARIGALPAKAQQTIAEGLA